MDDNQTSQDSLNSQNTDNSAPLGGLGTPPADEHETPDTSVEPTASPSPSFNDPTPSTNSDSTSDGDQLLEIKNQALSQLAPLVRKLDQSPEEQFKTTMMLIQASDNKDLIKDAYSAAEKITDEKAKAQALLDIVNEINYFTHQPN